MRENYENEMEDFSENNKVGEIPSQNIENENNEEPIKSMQSLPEQENEEGDEDIPKLLSLDNILKDDSDVMDSSLSSKEYYQNNDIILAKYLYVIKDFVFMFILIIASGLNFSYLYFTFLLL